MTQAPAASAGPPTYLKFDLVFNKLGQALTVQAQAYALDSQGRESYSGYSIRNLAVTSQVRNEYNNRAEWLTCNERMEGIRIKTLDQSLQVMTDLIWPGIHCYGDAKKYFLEIDEEGDLIFGPYTGTPATPKVKATAPAISWNKNEAQDTLSVVTASSNADWSDIQIELNANGGWARDAKAVTGTKAGMAERASDTQAPIRAGDYLHFCADAGGQLMIVMSSISSGEIVKTETFTAATCPS